MDIMPKYFHFFIFFLASDKVIILTIIKMFITLNANVCSLNANVYSFLGKSEGKTRLFWMEQAQIHPLKYLLDMGVMLPIRKVFTLAAFKTNTLALLSLGGCMDRESWEGGLWAWCKIPLNYFFYRNLKYSCPSFAIY